MASLLELRFCSEWDFGQLNARSTLREKDLVVKGGLGALSLVPKPSLRQVQSPLFIGGRDRVIGRPTVSA